MHTDIMISESFAHFIQHQPDEEMQTLFFAKFAREQLKLDLTESMLFSFTVGGNPLNIKDEMTDEKFVGFYTWYYYNYMALPAIAQVDEGELYNIAVSTGIEEPIDNIEVHPVRMFKDGSEIRCEPCPPEEAAFWSVYLHQTTGGNTCIADCKDEPAARDLEDLIRNILRLWTQWQMI